MDGDFSLTIALETWIIVIFVDVASSTDVFFACGSFESTFLDFEDDVRVVCGLAGEIVLANTWKSRVK